MKVFVEAVHRVVGAYEMRYWAVFSFAIVVADMLGFVSQSASVVAVMALALGGWLVGVRLNREDFVSRGRERT